MTESVSPELLLRHAHFIRRIARGLLLDVHQADDVAQDACLAALERPPPKNWHLRRWLVQVTRRLSWRTQRTARRRTRWESLSTQGEESRAEAPDDAIEREEILAQVTQAVLALRQPYRRTVMLHYYEDPQGLFGVELIEWRTSLGKANLEFALRPDGATAYHDLATIAFSIAIDRKLIGHALMRLTMDDSETPTVDFEGRFEPGAVGEPFDAVRYMLQLALDARPARGDA